MFGDKQFNGNSQFPFFNAYIQMIHEVTVTDHETTLHASTGDTIRIQLEENPTTGYAWRLGETEPFFSVSKNEYELLQGGGIGSGGMRTIELKVEQSGSATIQMQNWQRWSGDVYQTFQLHVSST